MRLARPRFPWRHAAVTVALSLAIAAGYYLRLPDAAPFAMLEAQTLAWRFQLRGPVRPPGAVAIVALDDRTIAYANTWPLPRKMLAEAVERVEAGGATAIGLDLLLLELEAPSDGLTASPGDLALRTALAAADRPVLGAAFTFGPEALPPPGAAEAIAESAFRVVRHDNGLSDAAIPHATGALVPTVALRQVARLGHVNVPVDEGGTLQRLSLAIGFQDQYLPGFPVALAARHLDLAPEQLGLRLGEGIDLGRRFVPSDGALRMTLNYYGPTGTIPTFSMLDLLEDRLPADVFAGRAVMLGATALGVGDTFATPYSGELPGVEALATAAANLISGQVIGRTTPTAAIDLSASSPSCWRSCPRRRRPSAPAPCCCSAGAPSPSLPSRAICCGSMSPFPAWPSCSTPPGSPSAGWCSSAGCVDRPSSSGKISRTITRRSSPTSWPRARSPGSTAASSRPPSCSSTSPASPPAARESARAARHASCATSTAGSSRRCCAMAACSSSSPAMAPW